MRDFTWLESCTTFGELLKHLRIRAQLNQRDLALAVGYSEAQISRLETNARAPTLPVLRALFIPALGLEDEPGVAARLLDLAETGRPISDAGAPTVTAPERLYNLPRQISSFIGREQEIDQVVRLVQAHPLVTLTGSGGVGKTRLGQAAARELVDDFSNGVWYVELAALADPLLVPQALTNTLGIRPEPGKPLLEAILAYFYDRQALLVLDNCEHLLAACAGLAQVLLSRLPRLKILATSRAPMGVNGEAVYRVPSLDLPPAENSPDFEGYEAVRLFLARASEHQSGFTLAEGAAPALARICRRLDGIPLAIELAAARTRLLSVEQIAERLEDVFSLLSGGSRAGLARHQTLRACIDWSYQLLTTEEQILLARLSVFAGGWTLEAAEAVGRVSIPDSAEGQETGRQQNGQVWKPDLQEKDNIIDLLSGLVDKSLVQFSHQAGADPRYRMLETVRQYARERLAERGEVDRLRRRHLAYFIRLTEQNPGSDPEKYRQWRQNIIGELDNIRLALDWALAADYEAGLRLCLGTQNAIDVHHSPEIVTWLERLLAGEAGEGNKPPGSEGFFLRGAAYNIITRWRMYWGQQTQALQAAAESKAIFESLGEAGEVYLADTLITLGAITMVLDPDQSRAYLEASLEILQRHENKIFLVNCYKVLAHVYDYLVDHDRANGLFHEGLRLSLAYGFRVEEGMLLYFLGWIAWSLGNPDQGLDLLIQGQAAYASAGEYDNVAGCLYARALLAWSRDDDGEVLRLCDEMAAYSKQTDSVVFDLNVQDILARREWTLGEFDQANSRAKAALAAYRPFYFGFAVCVCYVLARVAIAQGQFREAGRYLRQYDDAANAPRYRWKAYSLHCLGLLASVQADQSKEQASRAALLFGAQEALFPWLPNLFAPVERREYERALAAVKNALGEEAFTAAWARGQCMPRKAVYAFMLAGIEE